LKQRPSNSERALGFCFVASKCCRSTRQGAGLKEEHLLRNTDDPNEVVMLFEAKDIQKAKEFAGSADLREAMQNAGVVDKPDIYFLG
jgi:hypothetical protein